MEAITISKKLIKNDDLVIIPRKEYEYIKSQMIPSVYLKGKAAQCLDKRVKEGLQEYKAGKTETLKSFLKKDYPRLYKKYGS
jgi:hypothetical protein